MKHTIVITGASRGIGRAAALSFAKRGYPLFLTSNSHADDLEETASMAAAFHVPVFTAPYVDIGDYEQCRTQIWEQIQGQNLTIEGVVNNAGISYIGLLQDMSYEDWDRIVRVNLGSVFTMCKFAIPHLLKLGYGKIINISSVWGNVGASCEVAYSATKGGINSLTKALAKELAPSNIQVNAVAFGAIDTSMNSFLNKEERDALIDEIPAGRLATPEEAGELIAAIYQDCGKYLTGQIISMDGGWC